jgi:hypothetical protein
MRKAVRSKLSTPHEQFQYDRIMNTVPSPPAKPRPCPTRLHLPLALDRDERRLSSPRGEAPLEGANLARVVGE